jgi:type II secretory pathway pseudopilin PulG
MVVLLIMAILLAIAIPTFLGVSGSANDRAAQSNLNTALTNAKSYYQQNSQTFTGVGIAALVTALASQEPSISWTSGASTNSGQISVAVATDGNGIALAAESKTKSCFYLVDNEAVETSTATTGWITSELITGNQLLAGTWYGGTYSTTATCSASVLVASGTTAGTTQWNTAGTPGWVPVVGEP